MIETFRLVLVGHDRWGPERAVVALDEQVVGPDAAAGLDAIDGTPPLDAKPWTDESAPRGAARQPAWATELMADYYARG